MEWFAKLVPGIQFVIIAAILASIGAVVLLIQDHLAGQRDLERRQLDVDLQKAKNRAKEIERNQG